MQGSPTGRWARASPDLRRYTIATSVAGLLATLLYVPILWSFKLAPLRQALGRVDFANFYDVQARALRHGHLAVPRESLGIEGFIVDGREYMYFPPGPALARMPIQLFTDSLDGRLTAISMLLAWCASVVLVVLLVWRVRHTLRGSAPLSWTEATAYGALVLASTAGSVLLYLGAMPWVYHEAYAWSVALALASTFNVLGLLDRPTLRRALGGGAIALAAVLTRSPVGWACVVTMLAVGIGSLMHQRDDRRIAKAILVGALLPALVSMSLNWAKFQHPYLFPLEKQVWTSVNEHRRDALDANGGGLVNPDIMPSTLVSYFRPDGIRFVGVPPFITFPAEPATAVGPGFLDQTYRTGSAVPFMPALVVLALWGAVTIFRPRGPSHARFLRLPVLGLALIAGPMLIYGYISYRYLADLLPVLVLGASIGLVDLAHLVSLWSARRRTAAISALMCAVTFGILANSAVAITTERLANPGSALETYVSWQEQVGAVMPGRPLRSLVTQSEDLPASAPAEHLQIIGDCDAVYVGQAETTWPWVPVVVRERKLALEGLPAPPPEDGERVTVTLATVAGYDGVLTYEQRRDGEYRLAYRSSTIDAVGGWAGRPDPTLEIVLRPDETNDSWYVIANGGYVLPIPLSEYNDDWLRQQNLLRPASLDADALDAGLTLRELPTPRPELCRRLSDHVDQTGRSESSS